MKVSLVQLNGAFNGLATKIKKFREYYRESLGYPEVRSYAEEAAGRGPRIIQAGRMFQTIREKVNYVADPEPFHRKGSLVGVEYTKAPWQMVKEIKERGFSAGDCDDQASLSYSLLKSAGIPAVMRVVWYGGEEPKHIYCLAMLDGKWIAFDTTQDIMGKERGFTRAEDFQ